jgi:hypothetical protein
VVVTYTHKYQAYRMKALGILDGCLFPFFTRVLELLQFQELQHG